ncbi:ABC-type proline/glycine betaine transport system permease subunit [Bradyrhizobium yuanmingense]
MLDRAAADTAKNEATRPVHFRGAGFVPASSRYGGWIALALVIAIWQAAGSAGLVNALFLPTPSAIVRAIYQLAVSGALWQHVSASLLRIGVGWLLGTAAGIAVGFAIGLSRLARSVGITFISALFPIPKIALLPLLILWLGIGEEPKIATIALGVFFSTAISVYSGVDAVPRNLIRMAQSFNVPFATIVRKVIWPGALPRDPCRLPHHRLRRAAAGRQRRNDRRAIRRRRLRAAGRQPDADRSAARRRRDPVGLWAGGREGDRLAGDAAVALALDTITGAVGWAKRSVPTIPS